MQILNGARPGDEVVVVGGLGVDDKAKVKKVDTTVQESDDDDNAPEPTGHQRPEERRGQAESQMSDLSTSQPDDARTGPPATASRSSSSS